MLKITIKGNPYVTEKNQYLIRLSIWFKILRDSWANTALIILTCLIEFAQINTDSASVKIDTENASLDD